MAFGRYQALCPNLGILSVTHFLLLWACSHSLRWRNSPCFPLSLAWAPSWLHQPLSAMPPAPLPPCCMPQGQLPQYHPHFHPFLSGCSTHAAPAWPQCFLGSWRSPPPPHPYGLVLCEALGVLLTSDLFVSTEICLKKKSRGVVVVIIGLSKLPSAPLVTGWRKHSYSDRGDHLKQHTLRACR